MKTSQNGTEQPAPEAALLEKRLELLQGISVFFTLPDADLRRLARKMRPLKVKSGTTILSQGESSHRMFVIESGRCELRAQWAPDHSVAISLMSSGDFFGIGAVAAHHQQLASVTALETCDLLELEREDLDAVLVEGSPARSDLERLVEQRRQTIDQLVGRAQQVSRAEDGKVIAIYSVKGGAGKTTIGVNLAAALGHKHRGECVLLDLGLPYNHSALVANLVPTGCLALSEYAANDQFEEALLSTALHHPTGMMVLPSILKVEQSELITPQLVQRALDVLQRTFSYVVVDLSMAITEVTLGVLERAALVLVVVTPELPTLKDTADFIAVCESVLTIPPDAISLILNHPRPRTMLSRDDAERVIGRDMLVEIVHDGARFDRASVVGEVLVASEPSSPAAKGLLKLADRVAEVVQVAAG
jgi:Flp pilus assembly CpaE family ATPase